MRAAFCVHADASTIGAISQLARDEEFRGSYPLLVHYHYGPDSDDVDLVSVAFVDPFNPELRARLRRITGGDRKWHYVDEDDPVLDIPA